MTNKAQKIIIIALVFIFIPVVVWAHQPRLVDKLIVNVQDPETSQAFYGELKGVSNEFVVDSKTDFRLYVGLLVPDILGVNKDLSFSISRLNSGKTEPIALFKGADFNWTPFFEEFAKDNYFWGPEFKAEGSKTGIELKGKLMPAGTYLIKVFSPTNEGRYSLAIGDKELFPLKEMVSATITVPKIKSQFFNESPLTILASPFGWGYLLALYVFAFLFGLLCRALVRRFSKNKIRRQIKNIGLADRVVRFVLGLALLAWALFTSWNPILIFISGFLFFETIFSWCGLFSIFKKSSHSTK